METTSTADSGDTIGDPAAHTPAYAPVDLDTCEAEPIHIPGAIQPHGVLLAVDDTSGQIVMASANAAAHLGIPADEATALTLAEVLGEELAERIMGHVDAVRGAPLLAAIPTVEADTTDSGLLRGEVCDIAVHRSGKRVVVELETLTDDRSALTYTSARGAMARLVDARTVVELADRLAQEIRGTTGFDRVMVYRFDQDWNGEVIAEDKREDLNSFYGLHYPATDIPAQARRLYTVNWIRLISDISYTPVPIVPVHDPGSGEPLDLSFSTLRSVSPIHVEYLSNMGVTASMSVSLIVDGQLWGLIACHHYSGPHRPSHEARAAAEFLGQIASQMMAERERNDVREKMHHHTAMLTKVTKALVDSGDKLLEELVQNPGSRELLGATGIALNFDGVITSAGTIPPHDVCQQIALKLRRPDGDAAATHHLASLDPAFAEHAAVAAGCLIVGTSENRWLAWYRPEMEQVVTWGGDPANAKLYEREGDEIRLSPRKSFDKWREVVRGQSLPWPTYKLDLANSLRAHTAGLLAHRTRQHVIVAESLQRSIVGEAVSEVRGLQVAATYEPANEYQLGGDWWDCQELPDGRIAFVVGDVAGHGVDAVAAMSQVRTALRAYLFAGLSVGDSLDLLDRMMAGLMGDQVASVLALAVDPSTGDVEMINAGHPAPILFGDGEARVLEGTSRALLGIGSGTAQPIHAQLPPGATLLAYTDGLLERRGRDLATTQELLRRAGGAGPRGDDCPEVWAARLIDAVPGDRDDDTTLLAVRRPS